jgi:pimeloyl-ACP methyl ester carboxylesterase
MTGIALRPAGREPSPARQPDAAGFVERDGVRVAWERHGTGSPTVLLMPTWSIFPSRHWKLQVPDLARHFRVVTFDGRGNGRSDRPSEPAAYADTEFVADAAAVLDATDTDRAVVVGLSMGGGYTLRFAVEHPERTLGIVLIGAALDVRDRPRGTRDDGADPEFEEPRDPEANDGWGRYNVHFWQRDWPAFAEWFVGTRIFSEAHSTKAIEDGVGWALGTGPEVTIPIRRAGYLTHPSDWPAAPSTEGRAIPFLRRVRAPALVIHGTDDRVIGIKVGRRVARELGAPILEIEGGGHAPHLRDPIRVNLAIREFVGDVGRAGR